MARCLVVSLAVFQSKITTDGLPTQANALVTLVIPPMASCVPSWLKSMARTPPMSALKPPSYL